MNRKLKSNLLILLAAFIWGTAFLAQKEGGGIGTFTFNGLRFLIGGIFLMPVIAVLDKKRALNSASNLTTAYQNLHEESDAKVDQSVIDQNADGVPQNSSNREDRDSVQKSAGQGLVDMGWNRLVLIGGICCGIILLIASSLQQYGVGYTTLGKAGFITALYTIIVPVFSLLLGKRIRPIIWMAAVLGITGLYFLSIYGETLSLSYGDAFMLACAFGFAVQIMMIDHFSPKVDGVKLSCVQFLTIGLISLIPMIMIEHPTIAEIVSVWPSLIYAGVFSSGIAYTLQVVGQKHAEPTQAALIMCMESVFSMLTGFIVLGERMSIPESLGAALIFSAVVLAQLPDKKNSD